MTDDSFYNLVGFTTIVYLCGMLYVVCAAFAYGSSTYFDIFMGMATVLLIGAVATMIFGKND